MPREARSTRGGEQADARTSWAQRLAQHQHQHEAAAPKEDAEVSLLNATEQLWLPFDTAVHEANAALEAAGEPARISVTRTSHERNYSTTGPDGSVRTISVYLVLSVVDGQLSGGAYISTNQSRLSMYLMPSRIDGHAAWIVASSGRAFDDEMVQDLFLSVFADDPAATHRLSPLSGADLFETPWT
jgi:hypothetical protein